MLYGASYGGMVITGVADRVPEGIAHLVYGDAYVPRDGEAAIDLIPHDERRAATLARAAAGEWLSPLRPDAPPRYTPHPLRCGLQPIQLTGAGAALPRTYLRATRPPDPWMELSAGRARTEPGWRYLELPCGHRIADGMPRELACTLLEAAHS